MDVLKEGQIIFIMTLCRPFTSYAYINKNLNVTPESVGRVHFSSEDDPLTYLQPEFTLDPYTSKRGHILFWMENKESIQPGQHKMTIVTSRKNFIRKIELPYVYESAERYLYMREETYV